MKTDLGEEEIEKYFNITMLSYNFNFANAIDGWLVRHISK